MSTRCNVILHNECGDETMVLYHHYDGDPEAMKPKLRRLLSDAGRMLEKSGTYMNAPEHWAALLITLSLDEKCIPDFVPCFRQHDDAEHLYRVYLDGSLHPDIEVSR